MSRLKQILVICSTLLFCTQALYAESYSRVVRRDLWGQGRNVTSILRDSVTVSYAELYYGGEQGEFRDFSDGSSLWSAGAETKSVTHLDNLSMIGSFSYDHSHGADMCGSMFISPGAYPFDLLEFTPGEKTLQTYSFMGGLSSRIDEHWSVGVKGEFVSQNYAKFKDLRHYNYRMELSIVPSVSYSVNDITMGLSYIFSRNSETIRAQEIGSSAAAYYAFLDKGLMRGAYETWGGTGVHLDESGVDGFPVRENFNGAALQFAWRELYGEVEYLRGCGEVGEKQTYWFDFPSNHYTARVGYRSLRGDKLQIFRVDAEYYTLTNFESVLGSVTENGITTTVKYGSNEIFSTQSLSLTTRYEMIELGGGELAIGANYYRTSSRSTLMYPYVDECVMSRYQIYAEGMLPLRSFELRAGALLSTGEIAEQSYQVSDDIDAGDKPTQLVEYYNIENEYLTATQLRGSLALRYNHPQRYYAEIGASLTRAFDLSYIGGASRWSYLLKIGYKF